PGPSLIRPAMTVSLDAKGETVATTSDNDVQLWDARSGRRRGRPLMQFAGTAGTVAISADGRLVAASVNNTVRVWDLRSRRPIRRPLPPGHTGTVTGVAFSGDGQLLASAGGEGTVRLWNPRTGAALGGPLSQNTSVIQAI